MLFILFSVGEDRYAIASSEIQEVVPYARLKVLPCTQAAFAGVLNLRGEPVPVLDVKRLANGDKVEERLDSRIILCKGALQNYPDRLLGFLAERVTETRLIDPEEFKESGASSSKARWLGKVFESEDGRYVQWIYPRHVLSAEVVEELVKQSEDAA